MEMIKELLIQILGSSIGIGIWITLYAKIEQLRTKRLLVELLSKDTKPGASNKSFSERLKEAGEQLEATQKGIKSTKRK